MTCGGGSQSSKRTVSRRPQNGGRPCSGGSTRQRSCNDEDCPTPCQCRQPGGTCAPRLSGHPEPDRLCLCSESGRTSTNPYGQSVSNADKYCNRCQPIGGSNKDVCCLEYGTSCSQSSECCGIPPWVNTNLASATCNNGICCAPLGGWCEGRNAFCCDYGTNANVKCVNDACVIG